MKKTVALMRVSTQDQELASQRQAIEDYCKANRIVIDEWIEEHGVSGYKNKLTDRIAIQQIENMALSEELDTLIIFNLDRIGRTLEGNIFMATMSECNVKVISVTEGLLNGDDMNSELLTSIKFAIAKIESKKISARSKAGKRATNEKGLFAGGRVPLGYKVINQQAVIVEEEAEIVRELFKLYIEKGTSAARKELNDKGLFKGVESGLRAWCMIYLQIQFILDVGDIIITRRKQIAQQTKDGIDARKRCYYSPIMNSLELLMILRFIKHKSY